MNINNACISVQTFSAPAKRYGNDMQVTYKQGNDFITTNPLRFFKGMCFEYMKNYEFYK